MYNANFAKQLETSPRPYHTLAQAFAATTGTGIDTRVVQKLLKTYAAPDILNAIETMGSRDVSKPVPYLVGILKKRANKELSQQAKETKFSAVIDMAREPKIELEMRSPFDGTA